MTLLFDPENTGLINREQDLCQFTFTIPAADLSTLNMTQAVAIRPRGSQRAILPTPMDCGGKPFILLSTTQHTALDS